MKRPPLQRRTLALIAVLVPLLVLLAYVALRSGPLAPVAVTETRVESRAIRPALFGIGTVETRYTYRIGPTFPGRLARLDVQVGDHVAAGQVLGEMDPVDLDDRIRSQEAALRRTDAALLEAQARQSYAAAQEARYAQLFVVRSTSEEILATKRQELRIADAALAAAREERARVGADRDALVSQRANLKLVAPGDGLVTLREADPGTTIVAGEAVVEVIDPASLWISNESLEGRVLRIEPTADAVTEEMLAKVVFAGVPAPLPPLGELAEVTIDLSALPAAPVIPNAAVQRQGNQVGVWQIRNGRPEFVPVKLGRSGLDGDVQVIDGLVEGARIIVYSEKALGPRSRIRIVERIAGTSR